MLQLVNKTPFAPGMFLFPDADGVDTVYAVVKATFDISGASTVPAAAQRPVQVADEYYGPTDSSSLKYASEAHLAKPGTDLVVVGDAIAFDGKAREKLDVLLRVGHRSQTIRVWGERRWQGSSLKAWPGSAEPFVRIPLVYERAFGGTQLLEKRDGTTQVLCEPCNPVGRGFLGKRSFEEIQVEPVPNLEDPNKPISFLRSSAPPVGFGFVAPWWAPRYEYGGTYDDAWLKRRAPYLPKDFDSRYFCAASKEWVFEKGLQGGAEITIENMSRNGILEFTLPSVDMGVEITVAGKVETPPLQLETVLIEPNDVNDDDGAAQVIMTWRAAVPCDKKALEVSEVKIIQ